MAGLASGESARLRPRRRLLRSPGIVRLDRAVAALAVAVTGRAGIGFAAASRGRAAPAAPPDFGHVVPVDAHPLAALPAGLSRFLAGELVGFALFVCGPAPFTRDFALLFGGH